MGRIVIGDRWKSLLEISIVYILLLLIPGILNMLIMPLNRQILWQLYNPDYANFFSILVSYDGRILLYAAWIVFIFVVMALKKADFSSYGFNLNNLDVSLKIITVCVVLLFIGYVIQFLIWPVSYRNLIDVLLISIVLIFLLFVAIRMAKDIENKNNKVVKYAFLSLPVLASVTMIAIPTFGIPLLSQITAVLAFIYFVLFVGAGEEILFRGYFQSRLNEVFGKRYRIFGISWGPGLLISAVLFSLFHFSHELPVLALALIGGLVYGFIREKTDSIAAPIVIHGTLDYFMYFLASISFL